MTISHGWTQRDFDADVDEAAADAGSPAKSSGTALEKVWIGFLLGSGLAAFGGYPLISLGTFIAGMFFLATNDIRRDLREIKQL